MIRTPSSRLQIAAVAVALGSLLLAGRGEAQPATRADEERARDLFMQGRELAAAERWGEALEYFRRSRALVERPSTVFNVGVCLFTLARHVEAVAAFDAFAAIADPVRDAAQIREATAMARQSREAIGTLRLRVSPANATVAVDGRAVPGRGSERTLALDPGEHVIRLAAPDHRAGTLRVSVLPGQRLENEITLPALPLAGWPGGQSGSGTRDEGGGGLLESPVFWVIVGVVVASAVIGSIVAFGSPGVEEPLSGTLGVQMTLTAGR